MADIIPIVNGSGVSNIIVTGVIGGTPGKDGNPGPSNNLTIGTVSTGASASASITGTSPNQVLNLILPAASGSTSRVITQTNHGFSVGQPIFYNGAGFTLSKADSSAHAEVTGIVTSVTNANTFAICTEGYITGMGGLTSGVLYYLSPSNYGQLTSIEPSISGQVSKPLFTADSTTSGYFHNYRGIVIGT